MAVCRICPCCGAENWSADTAGTWSRHTCGAKIPPPDDSSAYDVENAKEVISDEDLYKCLMEKARRSPDAGKQTTESRSRGL